MGKITVGGKERRAELNAGALLRFKREAGWDFLRTPENLDSEGLITLAWAGAKTAAVQDGEPFDMTVEEMADKISIKELNGLVTWLGKETAGEETAGDSAGDTPEESKKK